MMNIKNILVVEDDLFQQIVLKNILQKSCSATIDMACNGRQALNLIEQGLQPDIILSDLDMPEMDGIELLRRLAEQNVNAYIIIITSAVHDLQKSVIQMAHFYGLKNISNISKPLSCSILKPLLEKICLQKNQSLNEPCELISIRKDEIMKAFQQEQFVAYYQAHYDSSTMAIIGAEALVRWQHPEHGNINPFHFLSLIYELKLGYQLTKIILEQAISCCASWHQQGKSLNISVNISPSDLINEDFSHCVLSLLEHYHLSCSYLTLEVTETEISPNLGKSLENLTRLRLNGISISIDDFGTGHSSLSQLISSPFTELKIDQLFVKHMLQDNKHMAAVKGSLAIAKSLDLRVVAEGVECQQTLEKLIEMGCDVLQGYHLARPLPENDFFQLCS